MLLAQEYDADEHGLPYRSTERRRLVAPDLRARVAGYLGTAPAAGPGHRTDGVWVWPVGLADSVLQTGCGPQERLYEHLRSRSFLLPEAVGADALALAVEAVTRPSTVDPPLSWQWIHLAQDGDDGAVALLRMRLREDGSIAESRFGPQGWSDRGGLSQPVAERHHFEEVTPFIAAAICDRLANLAWRDRVGQERESEPAALRLARLYDGESPAGTPWFSPGRLRIPEPVRRERLAAYLRGGRLVVRVGGSAVDPLDPDGPPIPLGLRTDGVWIWSEALAHYVTLRGAAPELELLTHIEERGYRLPELLPDELVPRAGVVLKEGPSPRLSRPPASYYRTQTGELLRVRGRDPRTTEALGPDLRWAPSTVDHPGSREITEAEAVAIVDRRWAAGGADLPRA
jgi:hypothetical protein